MIFLLSRKCRCLFIDRNSPSPLIMIIRWVITTVLFSPQKDSYIHTILTLSPQTQSFLQLIIESVMNTLPQDDINQSVISEVCSVLEESIVSVIALDSNEIGQASHPLHEMDNSFDIAVGDHLRYREEIRELEIKVNNLQQSVATQRDETEFVRRQRDKLQEEVYRLENEISAHKRVVMTMEDQERRRSVVADKRSDQYEAELKQLREEKEQLAKQINIYASENENYLHELTFMRTNQNEAEKQYKTTQEEHEEEIHRLKEEMKLLVMEKQSLEKQTDQMNAMKQRMEVLKDVERQYEVLKREVCERKEWTWS